MPTPHLSKSRFTQALSCPTKLYYQGKPEYANRSLEDSFLASLAEGGFQVGALAKCHFPEGVEVDTLNPDLAVEQTRALMQREEVVIFEAAFKVGSLLVRTDILVKSGKNLELIEVKAKSFDSKEGSLFNKNGSISSAWKEYVYDVAFQKHVLSLALPGMEIQAFMMLVDKTALCPVDGLNQMFRVAKDEQGRSRVVVSPDLSLGHLKPSLLVKVPLDQACEVVYRSPIELKGKVLSFEAYVDELAAHLVRDEKITSSIGSVCGGCEFKATKEELAQGYKSGFHECWREQLGFSEEDFEGQTVLDLWNFRRKDALISQKRARLAEVREEDVSIKPDAKPGISTGQRQWLQVEKEKNKDSLPFVDKEGLRAEMERWVFPLHFIDFETSAVAIPFNKDRRPYEGIAFQFSHHIVRQDGSVHHAGEFLNTQAGVFPNYHFMRELKRQLEEDQGTIFRYADHENTYLNMIHQQLLDDPDPIPDRLELCAFIRSISKSGGASAMDWEGPRNMVDLLELVKRHYYHPSTRGSNSIKQVLPAVLGSSAFLREKYSKPIYGAEGGIPSLNFRDWAWVQPDPEGQVLDPYKLLPPMFDDLTARENTLMSQSDEIRDGGAALTAYARMQFEEMSDYERAQINAALKKYCELDTLAMVMIYEAFVEMTA